jgi:hypothetical protein
MSENSEKSSTKEGEKKISLPPWNSINQDSSDKKPVANGTVNSITVLNFTAVFINDLIF